MKLRESQLSLMYYQRQVEDSQKRLKEADEHVGRVRADMRENCIALYTRERFQPAVDALDVRVFLQFSLCRFLTLGL
jgi:hypothetical protein